MSAGQTAALRAAALAEWLCAFHGKAEDAFAYVLDELAEGKSLEYVAQINGLHYGSLCRWCRLTPDRSKQLDQALADQRTMDRDRSRHVFVDVLTQGTPESPPEWKDRIAAGKLLGQASGYLPSAASRQVNLNVNLGDWGEELRRAKARVIEHDGPAGHEADTPTHDTVTVNAGAPEEKTEPGGASATRAATGDGRAEEPATALPAPKEEQPAWI